MGGREGGQYFVAWLILKKVSIWVAIFFFWHIHYKSRLTVIFDFLGWHIITNWQFGMQMCFYLNYLKFLRVPQIRCSGNVTKNWKLSCIKINRVSLCALFWNWIRNQNGNIDVKYCSSKIKVYCKWKNIKDHYKFKLFINLINMIAP